MITERKNYSSFIPKLTDKLSNAIKKSIYRVIRPDCPWELGGIVRDSHKHHRDNKKRKENDNEGLAEDWESEYVLDCLLIRFCERVLLLDKSQCAGMRY